MGSSAQLYNLGWTDFGQSLKQTVGNLRSHGDLFDVTLAADGKTFPAHKLVLSASSPLFLDLIKVTPCKHPVILLPGVSAEDMDFLLEFIYTGEVNVQSDRLPSLFKAARILEIHGLTQGTLSSETPGAPPMSEADLRSLREKQMRSAKRSKRKAPSELSSSNDKWPRWGDAYASGNESTDNEGPSIERRQSPSSAVLDSNYHSLKQGSESAPTLITLHNVPPQGQGPGPGSGTGTDLWNKHAPNLRNRLPSGDEDDPINDVKTHRLHGLNPDGENHAHSDEPYGPIAAAADAAAVAAAATSGKGSSEQPVACPLCNFIIKQSRNLRRHLEIKHFPVAGAARPKKSKGKSKMKIQSASDADSAQPNVDAAVAALEHVQVEIKGASVSESSSLMETSSPPQLQQFAHLGPSILSHQMVSPSGSGYVSPHLQLLKATHGSTHPLFAAASVPVPQPGTHFLGLYGADNNRLSPH